jgi:hypothetical protein
MRESRRRDLSGEMLRRASSMQNPYRTHFRKV